MSLTTQSSDGFTQYRQPITASGGLPDATEEEETTKFTGKIMLGPEDSFTNYGDLDLKDNKSKPNRRRSRASKKTPMILLNANTRNFRALVQQFTGCQSASSSSFKGPINLNFGGGTEENNLVTADHPSVSMFGYNNFVHKNIHADYQVHDQQLQSENLQQVYEEDQERVFTYGSYDGDASLSTTGNLATYTTTIENMAIENNDILDDLPRDFSSNGLADDDFIL